jgi:hypothetical protein
MTSPIETAMAGLVSDSVQAVQQTMHTGSEVRLPQGDGHGPFGR